MAYSKATKKRDHINLELTSVNVKADNALCINNRLEEQFKYECNGLQIITAEILRLFLNLKMCLYQT